MSKQPRKTASLRSLMQFDLRYGVSLTTVILCKVLIGVKKKKKDKKKNTYTVLHFITSQRPPNNIIRNYHEAG